METFVSFLVSLFFVVKALLPLLVVFVVLRLLFAVTDSLKRK